MLDELRPVGLSDAARELGVDPFEVVRLMITAGMDTKTLTLRSEDVEAIRTNAGIEFWWADAMLPEDDNHLRAAVRGALGELLARGLVGTVTTRLDNLWRGLEIMQQVAIEQAVMVLLEEDKLLTMASPRGVQVSIAPGVEGDLEEIVAGTAAHADLSAVWQGT
ncbi:MAG: hypothetical protein JRI25_28720 [Deltaproteobacteria bacterium]|nr:hypothetical protein [Deltaproteobacteria bacterium]